MKTRRDDEVEMETLLEEIPNATAGLLMNQEPHPHEERSHRYPHGLLKAVFGNDGCYNGHGAPPFFPDGSSSAGTSGTRSPVDDSPTDGLGLAERLRAMHVGDDGRDSSSMFQDIWGSPLMVGRTRTRTPTTSSSASASLDDDVSDYLDAYWVPSSQGRGLSMGYGVPIRYNATGFDGQYRADYSPRKGAIPDMGRSLVYGFLDQSPTGRGAKNSGLEDSYIIQGKGLQYVMRETRPEKPRYGAYTNTAGRLYGCSPCYVPRKYSSLVDIRGYIYSLAKDQQGCRFLQSKFEERNAKDIEMIFQEIIYHAAELMVNPFANYLMQKLFGVCTEEQRLKVILVIVERPCELVHISLNQYGTRAVQRLIETLKNPQHIAMVMSALRPGFLTLIKDPNGNHVIQRCLSCLRDEDIKFIFEAAAKHCVDIATHQHGCCVLQRCIARAVGLYRSNLVMKIADNCLLLSQDSFGNYVVQFVLELKIQQANDKMMTQFVGNFVELSKNKFSSNVVEKCLKWCPDYRSVIINELLSLSNFSELLQHQYANYVIQSALSHAKGHLYHSLLRAIEPHEPSLATSPYCKRIFSRSAFRK